MAYKEYGSHVPKSITDELIDANAALVEIEEEIDLVNTNLASFQSANHTDLAEIEEELDLANVNISQIDSDLLAFKAANHIDLLAIQGKQDAQTAILTEIEEDTDSIEVKLDSVITQVTAINANTDTVETLITSTNTKLDIVHADLVVVEGKQDIQTSILTEIEDDIDNIEADVDQIRIQQTDGNQKTQIVSGGSTNSFTNPVFTENTITGTRTAVANDSGNITSGATNTYDYTVSGGTLYLFWFKVASSVAFSTQVQRETSAGVFTNLFYDFGVGGAVGAFGNYQQDPTTVANGLRLRFINTNRATGLTPAASIYTSFNGVIK